MVGAFTWGTPVFDGRPGPDTTWGTAWAHGQLVSQDTRELRALYNAHMLGDGVPTVVVLSDGWNSAIFSMQLAVINHDLATLYTIGAEMPKIRVPTLDAHSGYDPLWAATLHLADNLELYIPRAHRHVRIVVFDAKTARRLQAAVDRTPGTPVELVYLSDSRGTRTPIRALDRQGA
jgi:hypothetical protein